MEGESQGMGLREQANIGFGLMCATSTPSRMLLARPGTVGYRQVANINTVWGMGILALFAGLGQSGILGAMLILTILSQIEHRIKSRRNKATHSNGMGESQLTRFFSQQSAGRGSDAALPRLIGLLQPAGRGGGVLLRAQCVGSWDDDWICRGAATKRRGRHQRQLFGHAARKLPATIRRLA